MSESRGKQSFRDIVDSDEDGVGVVLLAVVHRQVFEDGVRVRNAYHNRVLEPLDEVDADVDVDVEEQDAEGD